MIKIIIIGATSGIGKELATLYAKQGHKIAIAGRRLQLLQELKDKNPGFIIKQTDVTQTGTLVKHLDELAAELNGVDLLIMSSGVGDLNLDFDFSTEKRTIETNVIGFTCVCDWAVDYFEKQGHGHLAIISSVAGLRGNRNAPSYHASKSYQISYLEGIRQKFAYEGRTIYTTDIRPGFVDTAMALGDKKFWVASVQKAGKQIVDAIENKKQVVYITKRWRLIGALMRRTPNAIYDRT